MKSFKLSQRSAHIHNCLVVKNLITLGLSGCFVCDSSGEMSPSSSNDKHPPLQCVHVDRSVPPARRRADTLIQENLFGRRTIPGIFEFQSSGFKRVSGIFSQDVIYPERGTGQNVTLDITADGLL